MSNKKMVPAWFVEVNGVNVDGPYFFRTAALMRLTSFPQGKVVRQEVPFVESSRMTGRDQHGR